MPAASRSGGRRWWPLGLAAVLVIAVVLAAWALQQRYTGGAGSSQGDTVSPYSIVVEQDGKILKRYDLAALQALPQSRVVIEGKEQTGPLLTVLLDDAGAGRYGSVQVRGAGLRDAGENTYTPAQLRRKVQLDFSDRGTVKVCGPALTRSEWVRDVISIDAR
jgi:hypothetical protein